MACCRNGTKLKPVNGGTIDKDRKKREFIVKFINGNVYEERGKMI